MRGLIILTLLVSSVWSGWWFVGTSAQKNAVESWFEQRRNAGWTAEVEDFTITGFPNRFDSIFTDLELSNPQGGWTWSAPNFQILALSYKPNHIIAVWPGEHTYSTSLGTTTIASEVFRGSVIFKPDTALSLDRVQLEIEDVTLTNSAGWDAAATETSIAFFANPDPDLPSNTYDLYVKALEFSPPTAWRAMIDEDALLADTIPEVVLDAALSYERPWDRFAVERTNPRLTRMNIRNLRFVWGEAKLTGTGSIDITPAGKIDGTLSLQAENWRELLDIIIAAELLPVEFATALDKGLTFLAMLSGNPESIEIPLRFANGLSYIGAIPIGPAPRVY